MRRLFDGFSRFVLSKNEYKEHALGLDFTCLVQVVTMAFCFPKSLFPEDLGCFVVMVILWESSLVIFLECEKYLKNVIALINILSFM